MNDTQNYSNHARYFPLLHFVLIPFLTLNLIYQAVRFYQEPSWDRGIWVAICVALILMILAARVQVLNVQNRVIRLEENLRYRELLSGETAKNAKKLSLSQIIALRFASDEELPGLIDRTANGGLQSSKEIKMAIKQWRADHLRA